MCRKYLDTINKSKIARPVSKGQALLHQVRCDLLPRKQCLTSAFVVVGHIASDKERLVLLKPVMQFSFTYGASRGFLYICLHQSKILPMNFTYFNPQCSPIIERVQDLS